MPLLYFGRSHDTSFTAASAQGLRFGINRANRCSCAEAAVVGRRGNLVCALVTVTYGYCERPAYEMWPDFYGFT
jgi:hypothetical protein